MDTSNTMPVVAGVEIPVDSEGRYNLNALHKASGEGANKAPAQWIRTQQAQEFVSEVGNQTMQICIVSTEGRNGGTFAHELIAVEYAGWISPAFRIRVNQTFIDYRTGKLAPTPQAKPKRERISSQLAAKMVLARAAKSWLKMSDTSTIRMLSDIAESEGIKPTFLPSYVNESLTKAITPMLKDMGHHLGSHVAAVVNPALEAMGILEHMSRQGSKGDIKKFWSLTDEGLKYGRNETNPNSPRQTIPLFFVDRFPALLEKIEAYLDGQPKSSRLALVARSEQPPAGGAA